MQVIEVYLFVIFSLLIPALVHHFYIIPYNKLKFLVRPIDFGYKLWDNYLFGATKTFRGIVFMSLGVGVSAYLYSHLFGYPSVFKVNIFWVGFVLGMGYSLGELPTSFIKRRLKLKSSEQKAGFVGIFLYLLEQIDSITGAFIFLLFTLTYNFRTTYLHKLIGLLLIGITLHVLFDLLLYKYGYKKYIHKPFFLKDNKRSIKAQKR